MLPRPFKIVRIGPVRLFVKDMEKAEAFYTQRMGLVPSEEIMWAGERCVFLRCNTEHHTVALYPIALRDKLGLSAHTNCMSFGLQLGSYKQLREAIDWLKASGARVIELPPELRPGIDYAACAIDPDGQVSRSATYGEVHIKDRCWIGTRVMIMPGVTIGEGTVIGAGALVTKDCDPGAVYVGVPAKRVR